jgi:hypothetical protein
VTPARVIKLHYRETGFQKSIDEGSSQRLLHAAPSTDHQNGWKQSVSRLLRKVQRGSTACALTDKAGFDGAKAQRGGIRIASLLHDELTDENILNAIQDNSLTLS